MLEEQAFEQNQDLGKKIGQTSPNKTAEGAFNIDTGAIATNEVPKALFDDFRNSPEYKGTIPGNETLKGNYYPEDFDEYRSMLEEQAFEDEKDNLKDAGDTSTDLKKDIGRPLGVSFGGGRTDLKKDIGRPLGVSFGGGRTAKEEQSPFSKRINNQILGQNIDMLDRMNKEADQSVEAQKLADQGLIPQEAVKPSPFDAMNEASDVRKDNRKLTVATDKVKEEGQVKIDQINKALANGNISQEVADTAKEKINNETASNLDTATKGHTKTVASSNTMKAAKEAGAVNADGSIDEDWLDSYNRSVTPSEFDTTDIADEYKPDTSGLPSVVKDAAEKTKQKKPKEDPGMFESIANGIEEFFSSDNGKDDEETEADFWDKAGDWIEANPEWAAAIAGGVGSFIKTGSVYEAAGDALKGGIEGMSSAKEAEVAMAKDDVEMNKLYTGESIEKYRKTKKITDLVGRKDPLEISGSPDQYKAVGGKTFPIWNKDGVAYTRVGNVFVPASSNLLSGRDVKSATAENEAWNSLGKNSVADVIDQIKSQPAEFRIPVPAKSMANRVQIGVNKLRKAFPMINPNDPNIGLAVDDWLKDNYARFKEEGKDFKWDTNVEKYMMNNIIMGKSINETLPSDAFEIGGDKANKHDINVEETALAWTRINNFIASNTEDPYTTPEQGMSRGWKLYVNEWKPGTDDEHPSVGAARSRGIPPFIFFLNTVDLE